MRIALVRRFCSLQKAGAERYCINLARQLVLNGHEVTLVGEGIDAELREEFPFIKVPVLRLTSSTKNRSFAINTGHVLAKHRHQFDIVHGLSRVEGLDTYRLTDPLQTHWIRVYYQGGLTRWLQQLNPRHRTILSLERRLFSAAGPRRIVTQSSLDAELLQRYFNVDPKRIFPIRNGVNTQVYSPAVRKDRLEARQELSLPSQGLVLAFAGMDFQRKGLETLLRSLAFISDRTATLLVAGSGDIHRFQRLAESLGLKNRVQFAGRVGRMDRVYAAADLFVLPTIYEPFPNVNLEAMACQVPVITTATAGGADLVVSGENGFLLKDPRDARELADAIDRFASLSEAERVRMESCCWETAREWTAEKNTARTITMMQEVLREKRCA